MIKLVRSTIVPAPVESVWALLRDFNAHAEWHPAVSSSTIERARAAQQVSCIRRFTLAGGEELREQLLTLSDLETSYSYCLLDIPVPLFNYVAHVRLAPVTDADHCFWEWEAQFDTRAGEEQAMRTLVGDNIMMAGFEALKHHLASKPDGLPT